jgi:hypothetical protein
MHMEEEIQGAGNENRQKEPAWMVYVRMEVVGVDESMQLVYLNLTNNPSNKTHLKSDFGFALSVSDNPSVSLRGFLLFDHFLARTPSLEIPIMFISLSQYYGVVASLFVVPGVWSTSASWEWKVLEATKGRSESTSVERMNSPSYKSSKQWFKFCPWLTGPYSVALWLLL